MCREYCLYGRLCRVGKISYVFGRSSIRRPRRDIEYDSGNSSGDDRISLRKSYRRREGDTFTNREVGGLGYIDVRYRVSVELCRSFKQTAVVSEFRFGNLRYHLSDFCDTHLYYRRFEEDALVVSVLGSRRKSVIDLYIQRNCRRVIP